MSELAWTLSTSQETIRRNLTVLAKQGLVSRFRGGAVLPPSGEHENTFQTRVGEHTQEKRVIVRYAAGLFEPGNSIFIDIDTTTLLLTRGPARQSRLTVVTNSLLIISGVGVSGNRAFMIGDGYHPGSEQSVGALTIEQIARFNTERATITVDALNGDGTTGSSTEEAEITHTMITQIHQLTVTTNSSKLDRHVPFQVFPLSRTSRLVVGHKPTGELWETLQQARVGVHEAPLRTPQA